MGFAFIAMVWVFYNVFILIKNKKQITIPIFILIFLLYASFSYFFNIGEKFADAAYIHVFGSIMLYLTLINIIDDFEVLSKMILIHIIVVIPIVLIMANRSYFYWQQPWLSPDWETGTRYGKNTVGMYLAVCFTYVYGYLQKNKSLLTILALIIIAVCALYTVSRGTLVSLTMIVLLYIVISKRRKLYFKTISIILSLFIAINLFFGFNYFNTLLAIKTLGSATVEQTRFIQVFDSDADGGKYGLTQRASHFVTVANEFPKKPFFGHGIESFRRNEGTLAHNDYLTMLYEYGFIGFAILLYIIFFHFVELVKVRKWVKEDYRWIVEAQIVQIAILSFTFMVMTSYLSPITWYTLAISAAVVRIVKNQRLENYKIHS